MHWLKQWRMNYVHKDGRKGIDRKEFAAKVRNRDTGCSEVLIAILEGGGITHPGIAQRIAKVTGCTLEQYNSMVHKMHHGGYTPEKPKKYSEFKQGRMVQPLTAGVIPNTAREVVIIDRNGQVISRHESLSAAARAAGCSDSLVEHRCLGKIRPGQDEFAFLGVSFRRAEEWDSLDAEQRMKQLKLGDGN